MKVSELIENLKKFDPEAVVCVQHQNKGFVQLKPTDMKQGTSRLQDGEIEDRDKILWIRLDR